MPSSMTYPEGLEKNRCPTCGAEVEEPITPGQTNYCSYRGHNPDRGHGPWYPEELITDEDDYEWCI